MTLIGTLTFTLWEKPWHLAPVDGSAPVDLSTLFREFCLTQRGNPCRIETTISSAALIADLDADTRLTVTVEGAVLIDKIEGFGFSNVIAYFEMIMQSLNGRQVIVTYDNDKGFKIEDDLSVAVYTTHRHEMSNEAVIEPGVERTVCQVGQGKDCCIFLTVGPKGFRCAKFDSYMARQLLYRHSQGDMAAGRIGPCRVTFRPEDKRLVPAETANA